MLRNDTWPSVTSLIDAGSSVVQHPHLQTGYASQRFNPTKYEYSTFSEASLAYPELVSIRAVSLTRRVGLCELSFSNIRGNGTACRSRDPLQPMDQS